jgi:hypothetical protein
MVIPGKAPKQDEEEGKRKYIDYCKSKRDR